MKKIKEEHYYKLMITDVYREVMSFLKDTTGLRKVIDLCSSGSIIGLPGKNLRMIFVMKQCDNFEELNKININRVDKLLILDEKFEKLGYAKMKVLNKEDNKTLYFFKVKEKQILEIIKKYIEIQEGLNNFHAQGKFLGRNGKSLRVLFSFKKSKTLSEINDIDYKNIDKKIDFNKW